MKKTFQLLPSIDGYEEILNDIRSLLDKAQYQAFKTVDNLRVQTYWQIGERIAREEFEHKERSDYGKQLIQKLAFDLGFKDKRSIYYMLQFYKAYPIVTTVCSQLSWSHYRELILLESKEERGVFFCWGIRFYIVLKLLFDFLQKKFLELLMKFFVKNP